MDANKYKYHHEMSIYAQIIHVSLYGRSNQLWHIIKCQPNTYAALMSASKRPVVGRSLQPGYRYSPPI
jgi:hypothetical protein